MKQGLIMQLRHSTLLTVFLTIVVGLFMFEIFENFFRQGSGEDLEALIKDGAYLVDVRSSQEFAENSVKGSVNIPLDQVQRQMAKFQDKKHIIVFCRSGNRSSQAKAILEQNGYTNVVNGGTWQHVGQFVHN
jgi:phage shock protein E